MIWFSSDSHLNHDNIIKYSERPFDNVRDMNEHMIKVWNDRVAPDDIVYHGGDFYFPPKNELHITADEILDRLNGKIYLTIGNHDIERYNKENDDLITAHPKFVDVSPYYEIKFGKTRFVLCHYPLETWRNAHHGWFHLHGHCHGTLQRSIPHRMDIGVDCHPDYAPFSAEELRAIFNAQPDYEPQDHHAKRSPSEIRSLASQVLIPQTDS